MCGIAGFVAVGPTEARRPVVVAMLNRIAHRGPDDQGVWIDDHIALGHRRLSIVDLSPSGHQPMQSMSGRYVIAFNGEIYNHARLRRELIVSGVVFRGASDTEVLLALIDQYGISAALERVTGMFAFAVWDRRLKQLTLVRDRMGEKPLYYGWHGGVFLFGSELKALCAHPAFVKSVDDAVLPHYFCFGYVPSPHSIFKRTYKLRPAEVLSLNLNEAFGSVSEDQCTVSRERYWSFNDHHARSPETPIVRDWPEAVDDLDGILRDSVAMQMQADVPLGAFLSGGIDSSTIVALMQRNSAQPIKTFCIGYHEEGVNEAVHAKAIARHLGTDHAEFYMAARDALDVVPRLAEIYDEPLADSSQVPTLLVARLAKKSVTVALTGDGGDELFLGYPKYATGNMVARIPGRRLVGAILSRLPFNAINSLHDFIPRKMSRGLSALEYLAPLLSAPRLSQLANMLSALNRHTSGLSLDSTKSDDAHISPSSYLDFASSLDMTRYLPDDILVKVDRAAMSVSLETRAPFLDRRVIEYARSLPLQYKYAGGGKRILRELCYRYIPRRLVERPKMGFGIPLLAWLRGDLREWAEELTRSTAVAEFLNVGHVQAMWKDVLRGRHGNEHSIWAVLIFADWYERQKGRNAGSSPLPL